MNTLHSAHAVNQTLPLFEPLENRRLLSASLLGMGTVTTSDPPLVPIAASTVSAHGKYIHAVAGEAFKAVVGQINALPAVQTGYTLRGLIDWGDGTVDSDATFVPQANGQIAVLGSHTYQAVGADKIIITVTEEPPPGTALPIILVSQIRSSAQVIPTDGGVTLNETAAVPFTAGVGFFSSNLSSLSMRATINWGDGTTSIGKILALPTAGLVGRFEVVGSHTYANTRSYLVNVIVTAAAPSPIVGPQPTPGPIILVADIDSVIDVLPVSPAAAA